MSNPARFLTLWALFLWLSCGPLWAVDEIEWMEDFARAQKLAAEQGKDLLIDFTGSDWCPWCWKLDEEVFAQEIFQTEAPKSYIFVKLDFPRKPETVQDPKIKEQNEKLLALYKERYQFGGYPTIYLADSDGTPFGQIIGYQEGGPEQYLANLEMLKRGRPMEDPGARWIEEFEVAKAKARYHKRDLLAVFTGSDRDGQCLKLDKEVFGQDGFKAQAPEKFVLVKLDYPHDKSKLTEAIIKQNENLAEEYPFSGYPTVYLMDAQGRPYAQTGYQEGGPEFYVKDLARMQEFKVKRDAALAQTRGRTVMVDGERQRVRPEGLELAKILDEALSAVTPAKTEGALGQRIFRKAYAAEIARIIALDANNEAGLKAKYEAPQPAAEVKADVKVEEKEEPAMVMALPKGQKIDGIWYDAVSYDYAREIAKKENKLTFIEFTGSDWCPPCIALEKNVFSQDEFHQWAAANKAVLVRVEYLKSTAYGPGLKEKVDEMRNEFAIRSWPTICILDPEGQVLYKNYTFPRGVEKFIAWADGEITKR